jgi:tape measure domain-containing protein
MPDILASVSVLIGAEISGFKAAMADARRELRGLVQFSEGLKDIGTNLTQYVSAPIALLGGASVLASAKMESLRKGLDAINVQDLGKEGVTGLQAMQQAATLTSERIKVLEEIAKAPGIGFEEAEKGDVRLRAVGVSAGLSAKILREFANAIALTGGGAAELNSVTVQLGQLAAKGKVLAQDLRPIIEAAPSVATALQNIFGTVDSEEISKKLEKLGQNSTDFIEQLTTELAKAPRVTGGLATAMENDLQAATQTAAKFGDGISKAFNLQAVAERAGNFITALGDKFAGLSPGVQRSVVVFGALVAATGPVIVAVGTLGAALPAITAGFATLGVTSLAALTPILPVAAAVAAAATLIYQNWDSITAYFQSSGEGGRLFADLADSVTLSVASISQAFGQLRGLGGSSLGDLIKATGIFKALFQDLAIGVRAFSDTFGGIIGAAAALLRGDFTQAAGEAKRALGGLIDPLAGIFGFTKARNSSFSEFFKDLNTQAAAAKESIEGLAGGNLAGTTRTIGLLEELKTKLKEVQEQRDKETTTAAITADNAQIKSLQAQIDKLEGVDKSGKKAADAITKLRTELAALSALDDVLAVPAGGFDNVNRRVNALNGGLKNLLEAGIKPSSAAFKAFADESLTLQQSLDKVLATSNLNFKPVDLKMKVTVGDFNPDQIGKFSQELLNHPVLVPFELKPLKTDFSADILSTTIELQKGLEEASSYAVAFGNSFDYAGARVELLQASLQKLVKAGVPATSAAVRELGQQLARETTLLNINREATAALSNGLAQLGTGLLAGLGQLAVGTTTLGQFGATVLGLVGKLATQLGEAIVAVGIGMLGLKTAFTNPFSAIAAGAALIVIGSALGAISSSLGSVGSGGAGASPTVGNYGQNSTQTIKVVAEFRQRGQDLVAIGRSQLYRSGVSD